MPDEEAPKNILRIPAFDRPKQSRSEHPTDVETSSRLRSEMRSREELTPIATRLAENGDLLERFKEVQGTDRERANKLISEVTSRAQELDPTITDTEGVRISLLLMGMFSGAGRAPDG